MAATAPQLYTDADQLADPLDHRAPLVLGGYDYAKITDVVCEVVERKTPLAWWAFLLFSLSLLSIYGISVAYLVWEGTGIWGLNNPVYWGWAIVNFVFWVGIGHAGTLISAVLYLFRSQPFSSCSGRSGVRASTAPQRR